MLVLAVGNASGQWVQSLGPYGGTINSFAFSTTGAGETRIFAATWGSGVFVSTNRGENWIEANHGITDQFMRELAVTYDEVGNAFIFAGTSSGKLFRSTDLGNTWWTSIEGTPTNYYWPNPLAVSDGNLLAIGPDFFSIRRSTDHGTTWSVVGWIPSTFVDFAVMDSAIFAGGPHGVFRSTDDGSNWTTLLDSTEVACLAISPGGSIFAGTVHRVNYYMPRGVLRSTDNGESWTEANNGLTDSEVFSIGIAPNGDIFAGTATKTFRSMDEGESWLVVPGLPFVPGTFASSPDSTGMFYAGMSGSGVFQSTDNGENWIPMNTGIINTTVKVIASDHSAMGTTIVAGTEGAGVHRSTDNGLSWIPAGLTNLDSRALAVVEGGSNGSVILSGSASGIFRSTDSGMNWNQADAGLTDTVINALVVGRDPHGEFTILAGSEQGVIYQSPDTGKTWTAVWLAAASVTTLAVSADGTILFAGLDNPFRSEYGGVLTSTDNGGTWVSTIMKKDITAFAVNDRYLFAVTDLAVVSRSSNDGTSWEASSTGLPGTTYSLATGPGERVFAGTGRSGVFLSTNNGDNWYDFSQNEESLLPPVLSLRVTFDGGYVLAGTYGAGVWRRPLSETTSVERTSGTAPPRFSLLQNYPNPFNPTTTIEFTLPEDGRVKLRIYNMLGEEVATLVNEDRLAGVYHQVIFDAGRLASGIYFSHIEFEGRSLVRKLILVK